MKNLKKKTWLAQAGMTMASSLMVVTTAQAIDYELWVPDQSNSVVTAGGSKGTLGSYINIIMNTDIEDLVAPGGLAGDAGLALLGCRTPGGLDGSANVAPIGTQTTGPCDVNLIFPTTLTACSGVGTVSTEGTLGTIGRLHGALPGPKGKYVNINLFTPGGGHVGIMDGRTKEAVGLWRVTGTTATSGGGRSNHMSFWNAQGTALLVANLHGRLLERIDVGRDKNGEITSADFNRGASLNMAGRFVDRDAVAYQDDATCNKGGVLISTVSGTYNATAMAASFTAFGGPGGGTTVWCKQNGCGVAGAFDGGRGGNVIVCPIVSSNGNVYNTFGGGGLLISDSTTTPMEIIGHYSNTDASNNTIDGTQGVNGAGCGGTEIGGKIYLNGGASASPAGATQSTFTTQTLPTKFTKIFGFPGGLNFPAPSDVFEDGSNTMTGGNSFGPAAVAGSQVMTDASGNVLASPSVRRDSHGMGGTVSGHYLHIIDRIQNKMEVINTGTGLSNASDYDLMSTDGAGSGKGPCNDMSVTDDAGLPKNDPAGDLMATSPNNDYLFVALRGPAPVTVGHAAQGSCPGVGVIRVSDAGEAGFLEKVIRTSNLDGSAPGTMAGGYQYTGAERSDIHGVAVRIK